MNVLTQFIGQGGESGPMRLVLVGSIAVAAFLFAAGALSVWNWVSNPARRRLEEVAPGPIGTGQRGWKSGFAAIVAPLSRYLLPSHGKERSSIEDKLNKAGLNAPNALAVYYGIKTALVVIFLVGWIVAAQFMPKLTARQVWLLGSLVGFMGIVVPEMVLDRLVARRQRALRNGFPDALDLLIVCVEAGLGLTSALQRVARELEVSHPALAAELERVNAEMQAGMDRELALRNLALRTGLEDVRGLVGLLVQTLRYGTSVADALRVYAEEFRDKRMQRAEERAASLGTKMIFPLIVCFFPSFFVVAVGPAVLRIMDTFKNMGTQ